MFFGRRRNDLRALEASNRNHVKLMYYGYSAVNIRGSITGQLYQFSRLIPIKPVDARDAESILTTHLFRRTR